MNRESYWDYMGRKMKENRSISREELWKQEISEMQKTVYWCYNRIRELNEELHDIKTQLGTYKKNDIRQIEMEF